MIKLVQMGGMIYNIYQIVSIQTKSNYLGDEEYHSYIISFSNGDKVTIYQCEYEDLMKIIKGLK